jgi:patatin-like phospholipase/acyl hydrolase
MLERIEALLARRHVAGDEFRLAHCFDLIAGTSTGAIIAAGLARSMRVAEVLR